MAEKVNGLIGRTLTHSFSVAIHRELGNPHYRLYELEPDDLGAFLTSNEISGLNVTIPYKRSVIPCCATLSKEAQAIGCVNTIVSGPGGLHGHNTDAYGFSFMARHAKITFAGRKVLIFGCGGASLTAQHVAAEEGARSIVVISRSGRDHYGTLQDHSDAEILVNTTPVGMYPEQTGRSIVDITRFPRCEGVLDVVYNPLRTALLMQAEGLHVTCEGGLPMLVAQAKAAEELFMGREIPDAEITRILTLIRADKENIVLIGMPGSGKTVIGAALAEMTGRELVDLDEKIAQAAGTSIPEIFRRQGEEAFRDLEAEQAARYGAQNGKIIVTGGGIVKREQNRAPLRQNGRLYHIERPTCKLEREGRPLSLEADLEQMYRKRLPLYARFRDTVIANSGTEKDAAEQIWGDFCDYSGLRNPLRKDAP